MELLEANGLEMRGRGDRLLDFAISREGSQATYADRTLILDWAERWNAVAEIHVSDLVDLQPDI